MSMILSPLIEYPPSAMSNPTTVINGQTIWAWDGSAFTQIDSRSVSWTSQGQTLSFTLASPVSSNRFRFNYVSSPLYGAFNEWRFFGYGY